MSMATLPVKKAPDDKAVETIEQRFRRLEAVWESATMFLSDAHKITEHFAFQEIIEMGEAVIPFMLHDLEKEAGLWVWALPRITGANPIRPEDVGDSRILADAWLRWGRENGYRW
jgi:hypothetical protein